MHAPGTEVRSIKKPKGITQKCAFLVASGVVVCLEDGEARLGVVAVGGGVEEHGVEGRIAEVAHLEVGGR